MTGGITLWKDRGFDVDVPRALTAEQRERYSRHLLIPEIGARGPAEAARREGAAARRRRARLADRALPRGRRRRHARDRRRRRRRPVEPPAPGRALGGPDRRCRRSTPPRSRSRRSTPTSTSSSTRRASTRRTSWRSSRATTSIVDGVDNFPTRYLLNDATVRLQIPVVSASILGFDGQLSVFHPYEGPCYRCLYPTPPPAELAPSCGANGVLGVLPGVMGLLQAVEVDQARDRRGRAADRPAAALRGARRDVHRAQGAARPDCPICSRDPESISDEEMGVFPDYEAFCAAAG